MWCKSKLDLTIGKFKELDICRHSNPCHFFLLDYVVYGHPQTLSLLNLLLLLCVLYFFESKITQKNWDWRNQKIWYHLRFELTRASFFQVDLYFSQSLKFTYVLYLNFCQLRCDKTFWKRKIIFLKFFFITFFIIF